MRRVQKRESVRSESVKWKLVGHVSRFAIPEPRVSSPIFFCGFHLRLV